MKRSGSDKILFKFGNLFAIFCVQGVGARNKNMNITIYNTHGAQEHEVSK